MSNAEKFLEKNFIVATPLISTDGKTFHCLDIDDVREYARLKSQEENEELVEALRDLWNDITGQKKSCGHEYTCICAGNKAKAILTKYTK